MTREQILALKPGEELDRLVAIHVFGEPEPPLASAEDAIMAELNPGPRPHSEKECYILGTTGYDAGDESKWYPVQFSTKIHYAWKVVDKLAPLVSAFIHADGWFKICRAEWADHNSPHHDSATDRQKCMLDHNDDWKSDDDRPDPECWSVHCHLESISAGEPIETPPHWEHGDRFCAYGATPMEAICKASLLTMVPRG